MTTLYSLQNYELFFWLSNICCKEKLFLILSDSLSSLQALFNLKYDHPIFGQILELYYGTDQRWEAYCLYLKDINISYRIYMEFTRDGKEIVFMWKISIFLTEYKLPNNLWFRLSFTHFLSLFLKSWLYTSFSIHIFLTFIVWWLTV